MNYTKIDNIYNKLEQSNVTVVNVPFLKERKSISYLSPNNYFWIGLNRNLISSEKEELCILMEEDAHYEVGITPNDYLSNSYCDRLTREKNEYRAKKFAVKNLIAKEKLFDVLRNTPSICVSELADLFEVTPQFMNDALKIYGII